MRRQTVLATVLGSAGTVVGLTGLLLWADRPGLSVEYFANTSSWSGRPVYQTVGEPRLDGPEGAAHVLVSTEVFSVRWRGWVYIPDDRRSRFFLEADGAAYLRLDGETLIELEEGSEKKWGQTQLRHQRVGMVPIEIGTSRTAGKGRLALRWKDRGEGRENVPAVAFYAGRPLGPRLWLRETLGGVGPPYQRLLGAVLVVIAVLMLRAGLRRSKVWLRGREGLRRRSETLRARFVGRFAGPVRGGLLAGLLVGALFVLAWALTTPFVASNLDGDDIRYLDAAFFSKKLGWILNRYVHIYLVKLSMWLRGGDPFLASRVYWPAMFAGTVAALAVSVRSLGPRWQLRTLAVAVFLLLSQPELIGNIGAVFADFSAMLFITIGVAVYLHALSRSPPSSFRWHALAIGVLTFAAFKSKETGIILLWLPLLFLWTDGRLNFRRFAHRLGYWLFGVLVAQTALMVLDAWILGDFLFSLRPENFAALREMNLAAEPQSQRNAVGWMNILWEAKPRVYPLHYSLRHLGILVVLGAVAAGWRRKRVELRLLHLMPLVYVLLMVVLHIRGTYILTSRYLFPILPISCVLGAAFFLYSGLEELSWSELLAPRFWVPVALAAAVLSVVVLPWRIGRLAPEEFLPTSLLEQLGWTGHDFLASTLGPATLLLFLATLALSFPHRGPRLAVLLVGLLAFFGVGLTLTRVTLELNLAVQRGELVLYPWEVFRDELETGHLQEIVVSPELTFKGHMFGQAATRDRIARMFFGRENSRVTVSHQIHPGVEFALGSSADLESWSRLLPELAETAMFDPTGQVVLVQPSAAVAERRRGEVDPTAPSRSGDGS
ncbi:MAG: hypothetical protein OES47_11180 [Acidobacteriota bacterium]|nr:hypothetical protein [Acidobacteriota bacterium]